MNCSIWSVEKTLSRNTEYCENTVQSDKILNQTCRFKTRMLEENNCLHLLFIANLKHTKGGKAAFLWGISISTGSATTIRLNHVCHGPPCFARQHTFSAKSCLQKQKVLWITRKCSPSWPKPTGLCRSSSLPPFPLSPAESPDMSLWASSCLLGMWSWLYCSWSVRYSCGGWK